MKVKVELVPLAGGGWTVSVVLDDGVPSPVVHVLELASGPVDAITGEQAAAVPTLPGDGLGVAEVATALAAIRARDIGSGDVQRVGRHLFDILLGPHWEWLKQQRPEARDLLLLLCWDSDQDVLNRLPWEAMYDRNAHCFLATHHTLNVATARIVRGTTARAQVVEDVPRFLFVICSGMDDAVIRPGLELMGLLRNLERGEQSILSTVRVAPSPSELGALVQRVRPHVVHLVGHGEEVNGNGGIWFKPASGPPVHVVAEQLAGVLRYTDRDETSRPVDLVVLSSCDTASSWSPSASPLAADLVHRGTPIVVAMAGEVSDTGCRLFTKRFAESVISGDAIAVAAAEGRRAAYFEGDPPADSVDWALPTLFVSAGTEPDFVPLLEPARLLAVTQVAPRVGIDLALHRPVFCARQDFVDSFDRILDGAEGLRVLVAYAAPDLDAYGPNRLLHELASRALRLGHLPILRARFVPSKEPTTPVAVAVEIVRTAFRVARRLGLEPGESALLRRVLGSDAADLSATPDDRYDRFKQRAVTAAVSTADIDNESLRMRLAEDVCRIHQRAVAAYPNIFDEALPPVVLMPTVHLFDKGTDALFADDGLLGAQGFGWTSPIPAVLTAAFDDLNSPKLADARGHQKASRQFLQLREFPLEGDQDLLIYQWVLMNPRPGFEVAPLEPADFCKVYAAVKRDGVWRDLLRQATTRTPRDFDRPELYMWAKAFVSYHDFCENNDEETWAHYVEQRG